MKFKDFFSATENKTNKQINLSLRKKKAKEFETSISKLLEINVDNYLKKK